MKKMVVFVGHPQRKWKNEKEEKEEKGKKKEGFSDKTKKVLTDP